MENSFYKCIFIGVFLIVFAVICYVCKKKYIFMVSAIIGIIYLMKSGIIYMAMTFVPPETKGNIKIVESGQAEIEEKELTIPEIEYFDNGRIGFGLDFLDL